LWSTETGSIVFNGSINANGIYGGDGSNAPSEWVGGNGGSYGASGTSQGGVGQAPGADNGGTGGRGAGGGVQLWTTNLTSNGTITSLGAGSYVPNGGTIKIFADEKIDSGTYVAGRVFREETEFGSASSSSPTSDSSISSDSSESLSSISSESSSSISSESLSSVSSESSISSISSPSSLSSQSSSSSDYGHLDAPTSLTLDSVNPLTRTVTLTWEWSTLNHGGDPVTPTGFVVERQIGADDYVVLSYSVLPNTPITNTSYSYGDVLTDADAAKVFALGYALSYRVKAYWVVP
jgi:hypothetical protein